MSLSICEYLKLKQIVYDFDENIIEPNQKKGLGPRTGSRVADSSVSTAASSGANVKHKDLKAPTSDHSEAQLLEKNPSFARHMRRETKADTWLEKMIMPMILLKFDRGLTTNRSILVGWLLCPFSANFSFCIANAASYCLSISIHPASRGVAAHTASFFCSPKMLKNIAFTMFL